MLLYIQYIHIHYTKYTRIMHTVDNLVIMCTLIVNKLTIINYCIIITSKVWQNLKIPSQEASEWFILYFRYLFPFFYYIFHGNIIYLSGRRWETVESQKLTNYLNSLFFSLEKAYFYWRQIFFLIKNVQSLIDFNVILPMQSSKMMVASDAIYQKQCNSQMQFPT